MATMVHLALFDVLSHHHHPGDVVFQIPANGDIDEDISKLIGLGDKFQLVVNHLNALQGIVHDILHLLPLGTLSVGGSGAQARAHNDLNSHERP